MQSQDSVFLIKGWELSPQPLRFHSYAQLVLQIIRNILKELINQPILRRSASINFIYFIIVLSICPTGFTYSKEYLENNQPINIDAICQHKPYVFHHGVIYMLNWFYI